MVNNSNSGKDFEMPVDIMEKWQRMVNIMSKLLRVPTGFIMKVIPPDIQIFTANVADTNPYHAGQNFELAGLYCEEVMKSDNLLCVPDALKDSEWDNNPEIPAGFIYYLGYPIHWPTGKMFGTICVQDYKNNSHATDNKDLLVEFRSVCEHDLLMIQMRRNLESIVAERTVDLRMSEERFRMTFEQAAVGIAHVALDGFFLRINQRFCDIVGYSTKEMLTRTFQDITHPDDLSIDLEYYEQMLSREIKTYSMEKRYFRKDTSIVWVNLTVSLVLDDSGKPNYFIAVVEDISERKEAEDLLGKSQAIAHIGNWSIKRGEEEVVLSDEARRIFGLPVGSTFTFEMFTEVIHPDDRDYVKSSWMTALNHGQFDFTYRLLVDGQQKWVAVKAESTFHKEDETISAVGTVQEITKRKQQEDKFELLVDQAGDAFFVLDFEGVLFDINLQACKSLGYSREELLGMNISEIDIKVGGEPIRHTLWDQLVEPGKHITFEGVHRRKDGSSFPVEVRLGRLDIEKKRFMLALARDITERKQKEEELKKQVEFQELVSRISTKFIDLPADKIDQAINEQFEEIGKFFNADRVTLGQLSEKGDVLAATHMWFSDKVNAEKLAADMMGVTYPNLVNHLKDLEYWSFSNPDDFSHWHPERETIEKTDFKSGLVINTSFEKSILEIFIIDVMHSNRVWTENTIEQVKLLGNVFSNAVKRKLAEQALLKEAEFKQLVSRVSTKFTGLSGVEFEQAIQNSLAEIGGYFGVDTVRLYQLSLKGEVLKFRLMWRSEHLAPPEEMLEIHKMIYPNLAAHYSKGESVIFSKFDDSPKWPEMRKILKFFGTKAGVGVPLESDKSGVDVFAMDKVLSEHTWPEDIIEQSKAIGKVILSAMLRREAEAEIQNGYEEIKQLKNRLQQENIYLQEEIKVHQNFDKIIGQSASLNYVLHRLEQVAPTDATVLIQGETGTGKELFAHALHGTSSRKKNPLIKVGCASLSTTLIESEFFGHEKGAFTGADKQRIGRFELANKGSIFLDEIGELSLELQAKLLRVLQEGEIERLGSSKTIKVDVRVIAATNRNLEEEVKEGRFREDLYYRLTAFKLSVPPLRDRNDDIPLLVRFFVEKLGKKLGKKIKSIPKTSMRKLENYSWPGNIRELQNTIENAIIISENEILKVEIPGSSILSQKGKMKLKDIERDHIIEVLNSTNWRLGGKGGAAELLGMKRTTLYAKMKKYEIERKI